MLEHGQQEVDKLDENGTNGHHAGHAGSHDVPGVGWGQKELLWAGLVTVPSPPILAGILICRLGAP